LSSGWNTPRLSLELPFEVKYKKPLGRVVAAASLGLDVASCALLPALITPVSPYRWSLDGTIPKRSLRPFNERTASAWRVTVGHSAPLKTNRTAWSLGLILLLLVTTGGCNGTGVFPKKNLNDDDYMRAVEAFNEGVRWREYRAAAIFVAPEQLEVFWKHTEALGERVRLSEVQIQRLNMNPEARSGIALLRYRFYYPTDPSIRSKDVNQKWRYDEIAKSWQVIQTGLHVLLEAN
jgi:hypothetical protein